MKKPGLSVLKRIGLGVAGLGLVAAVINGLQRANERSEEPEDQDITQPDPLSAELRRCSELPREEAIDDESCQRAWVLNRQRFFGQHFPEPAKD